MIMLLFFLIIVSIYNDSLESFTMNKQLWSNEMWSNDLIRRFNEFQLTMNNNNYQYNLDELQKQATPQDVEYLLKHGHWSWPSELQQSYMEAIMKSPLIKVDPHIALEQAMKIYNKNAMILILQKYRSLS
jgi:hypothetical protein